MNTLAPKLDLFLRNLDNEYKNIWYDLWWRYMPGVTVMVQWPRGWTQPDHLGNQILSTDPNDHYRPYMEQHIGRQGWDWDWQIDDIAKDTLTIKIRRRHAKYATIIGMMWA